MRLATRNTQAVLEKLFGKTLEEQLSTFSSIARSYRSYDFSVRPFGIHVEKLPDTRYGASVSIGFKWLISVVSFTIELYPHCCGSKLFHTFKVSDHLITQDQLDEVLNAFFHENLYDHNRYDLGESHVNYASCALGGANRIEVMMVETRDGVDTSTALTEVEPIENPSIIYKSLWNFFHKHSKRVRTRLEVNPNSGNVLHNMEVLF